MADEPADAPLPFIPLETTPDAEEASNLSWQGHIPDLDLPLPDGLREGTQPYIHTGWAADRNRIYHAMIAANCSASATHAFIQCGCHHWLYQNVNDDASFKVSANRCHSRFCVPCTQVNARITAAVLRKWIEKREVRFLTLTIRHGQTPLADQIKHLKESFNRLRERVSWKKRVTGGVAFFELTWNDESKTWHPHLHVLMEGVFFPHNLLSAEWKEVTAGSYIVHIKPCKNKSETADYVAKYVTKGWSRSMLKDESATTEAIRALHGRRLAAVFGNWKGLKLREAKQEQLWLPIMSLWELRRKVEEGDHYAVALLEHLRNPQTIRSPGPAPPEWPHECVKLHDSWEVKHDCASQYYFADDASWLAPAAAY